MTFRAPSSGPTFELARERRADLLDRLGKRFRVRATDPSERRLSFLDTHDWRLHRAGEELTRVANGRTTQLELTRSGAPEDALEVEREPAFAWDLPPGRLRERLTPIVRVRRLLPQLEVTLHTTTLELLDRREKTIVRMLIEDARAHTAGQAAARPLPLLVRVRALRGYDRERDELVAFLAREVGLPTTAHSTLDHALRVVGRDPERERSHWRVELRPSDAAGAAVRRILLRLLDVMDWNRPGLLEDLDTEFLHYFRVAIRRTRSLLGLARKALPASELARLGAELAWIGRLTTHVRDLDVFLLRLRDQPELEAVRPYLEQARAREWARMAEGLRSDRYLEATQAWRSLLEAPRHPADPPAASRTVVELASRRIRKLHRSILRRAESMDAATPVAEIHELRIECKKLRYLVDAFGRLYTREDVAHLLALLKRLQQGLGDFNDLDFQRRFLRHIALEMRGAPPEVLLHLGGWIERLGVRADELRPSIEERLRAFASGEDSKRMKRLLAGAS